MTYIERNSNELYHHGIKGQKWGRRRFQNSDGTLTKEGKARYKAYNKDYKEYKTLNRHVSASQRHLKEEGIMLDRVRDKYQQADRNYRKEMMKSNGLFGLKAAKKADKVAKAQSEMDKIGKDYDAAASSYGYANRIAKKDRKALTDHVSSMLKKYGEGSVKDIEYKTVKIGQNKLQKIMQGAPVSSIFGRERETDTFVKTGKTVADMPIVGNWYTANYTSNEEWKMKRSDVEQIKNNNSVKRQPDPEYVKKNDYFDNVSSVDKKAKKARDIKKAKRAAESATEKQKNLSKKTEAALKKRDEAKKNLDKAKQDIKGMKSYKGAPLSVRAATVAVRGVQKRKIKNAKVDYKVAKKEYDNAVKESNKAFFEAKRLDKKYKKAMLHSVRYSDELYHHGAAGKRWRARKKRK